MFRFIIIIAILCIHSFLCGQNINQLKTDFENQDGIEKAITGITISRMLSKKQPSQALEYLSFSNDYAENTGDKELLGNTLLTKAMIFAAKGDEYKSISFAKNAVDQLRSVNSNDFLNALDYYADLKFQASDFNELEVLYRELIEKYKSSNRYYDLGFSAHRLGIIHENKRNFKQSIEYYTMAAHSFAKVHKLEEETQSYFSLGGVLNNYGDYERAVVALITALDLAKKNNNPALIEKVEARLEQIKANKELDAQIETEFKQEQKHNKNAKLDTLMNRQRLSLEEIEKLSKEKQLVELKIRIQQDEYEKKIFEEQVAKKQVEEALLKEKLEADNLKLALENERLINDKKTIENQRLYLILIGAFLILLMAIVAYLIKHKSNVRLSQKNTFINEQNIRIAKQSEKISQSISYAKEIQEALLPSEKRFLKVMENAFTVHLPKDKVSGDFLWYHRFDTELIVCVADCTGHGVPGAFITIVLSSVLDKLVLNEGVLSPDKILEKACEKLSIIVAKDELTGLKDFKGGMDASIIRINDQSKLLEFSGARSNIVVHSGDNLNLLKGTRRSVDVTPSQKGFELKTLNLNKGDRIFMYTDGFADQKGGVQKEKYYNTRFREFLFQNAKLDIKEQGNVVLKEYQNWKGDQEQIDDVLVVGFDV